MGKKLSTFIGDSTYMRAPLNYRSPLRSNDLFESLGHSLDVIDPSTTLRVFLQNPNGLSIYNTNHFLLQDIQNCYNYGAGKLCLPETNTNWNQEGQVATIHQLFHRVWRNSSLQMSQTPDPFLSNYQPGGTLTAYYAEKQTQK
jgi:hypothetical protein